MNAIEKWLCLVLGLAAIPGEGFAVSALLAAGGEENYRLDQPRSVRVLPLYQRWSVAHHTFSEFSTTLSASWPVSRVLSLSLLSSQVSTDGDSLQTLRGLSDTQLTVRYFLESANLVFNLGLNVPSGQKEFDFEALQTSTRFSYSVFDFQVPSFGQGFNLSPGVTWATPLQEHLVAGLGLAFIKKGRYTPLDHGIFPPGTPVSFRPGNELLVTAGFDWRLAETAALALDVTFATYGKDRFGDQEIYAAGNRLLATLRWRQYFDFNELAILVRFRSRAKNEYASPGRPGLVLEAEKTVPDQFEVHGLYRWRYSRHLAVGFEGVGKLFQKTPMPFSGVSLYGAGIAPTVTLHRNFQLTGRCQYLAGKDRDANTFTGLEAGVGVVVLF